MSLCGNSKGTPLHNFTYTYIYKDWHKGYMVSGDTSPLRNNLKGDVRKKIERDKREETIGYKKIIKTSCTRANIHDIICARYVPVKKYPGTELVIKKNLNI